MPYFSQKWSPNNKNLHQPLIIKYSMKYYWKALLHLKNKNITMPLKGVGTWNVLLVLLCY